MQQISQCNRKSLLATLILSSLFVSACGGSSGDEAVNPEALDAAAESRDAATLGLTAGNMSWVKIAAEGQSFVVSKSSLVRFGTGSSWTGRWVTGTGQCSISFFGRDPASGKTKECDVLSVTPPSPPNLPPTITLSVPVSATAEASIALSATASDSDGTVAKVEFYAGSTLVATTTTPPYSATWTSPDLGSPAYFRPCHCEGSCPKQSPDKDP